LDTLSTWARVFFALSNSQQPAARHCKAGTEASADEERAGIRTFKFSNDRGALSDTIIITSSDDADLVGLLSVLKDVHLAFLRLWRMSQPNNGACHLNN